MFAQFLALSSLPKYVTHVVTAPGTAGVGRGQNKTHLHSLILFPFTFSTALCSSSPTWNSYISSGVQFQDDEKPVLLALPLDLSLFHIEVVQVENLECLCSWSSGRAEVEYSNSSG